MPHPDLGRVAMHMTEEALLTAVRHPYRATGAQRQEACVHLQTDVLAGTERTADSAEGQANLVALEIETRGDLSSVLVQPLSGHEQFDSGTARVGQRQRRFETEERLVLHAQLV